MSVIQDLVYRIGATNSGLKSTVRDSQTSIRGLMDVVDQSTKRLDDFGRKARRNGLILLTGVTALTKSTIDSAASFEKSMKRVQAVSQATTAEYRKLSNEALSMSTKTEHSAMAIADGMNFMAMAGFKANQIMEAMPSVLQLASAGMMDLGQSADIITNILTGYGMEISELAMVNDVLVSSMTGANVDLVGLGEAFKYAGPIAKAAGIEFKETASLIALMGNAGIQGSMAGTSLRQAMTQLLNPTKSAQDVMKRLGITTRDLRTNQLLPLTEILKQLEVAGADASDMMVLFGQRAGPAMSALLGQGTDSLESFQKRLEESEGLASKIELMMLNTAEGQKTIFQNTVNAIRTMFGQDLLPYYRTFIFYLQGTFDKLKQLEPEQRIQIIRFGAMAGAVFATVTALGVLSLGLSGIIKVIMAVGRAFTFLMSVKGLAIVGIILAVGLLKTAWDENWGGIQDKTEAVIAAVQSAIASFSDWWENSETAAVFKKAWAELVGIWTDDTKTLGEKLGASLEVGSDVVIQLGNIAWEWAGRKYDSLKDWWNGYTETVINEETGIAEEREIEGFKYKVKNFITSAWEWAGQKYDSLKDWWNGYEKEVIDPESPLLSEDGELVTVEVIGFKYKILNLITTVWSSAGQVYKDFRDWWNGYTATIVDEETGVIEEREIIGFKYKILNTITALWDGGVTGLKNWWNGYSEEVLNEETGLTETRAIEGFKYKITNIISSIWDFVGQKYDSLKDWWNGYKVDVIDEETGLTETREIEGFKYKVQQTIEAGWEWVEDKLPPEWLERAMVAGEFVQVQIRAGFELAGEIYEALIEGMDNGNWAPFWSKVSSAWSDGVLLGVTLSTAIQGAALVLEGIKTALGLVAATGIPGALGAISIAIKLMEAKTAGEGFEDFGANLAAGIIAGLLVGGLLGSPSAGALAFTVVFNAEIGEDAWEGVQVFFDWLAYNIQNLFNLQWSELMSLDEFMRMRAREQLGAEYEIEELDPELEKQRYQWRLYSAAGRLESEEEIPQEAFLLDLDEGDLRKAHSTLLAIGELSEALGVTVDSLMGMQPGELAALLMSQEYELTAGIAEGYDLTSRDLFNYLSNPPPVDYPVAELQKAAEELEAAAEAIEISAEELQEAAQAYAAPSTTSTTNTAFMVDFLDGGGLEALEYAAGELGIDKNLILAQWALETSYFNPEKSNLDIYNLGGIKAAPGEEYSTRGTWEEIDGVETTVMADFKVYEDYMEFAKDYVDAINKKWSKAKDAQTAADFVAGLIDESLYGEDDGWIGKYATNSNYLKDIQDVLYNIERYLDLAELNEMMTDYGYDSVEHFVQGVADGSVELEGEAAQHFVHLMSAWRFDDARNDATAQRWGWDFVKHFVLGVQKGSANAQKGIQEVAEEVLMPLTFDNPENDAMVEGYGEDAINYWGLGASKAMGGVMKLLTTLTDALFDNIGKKIREKYPELVEFFENLKSEVDETIREVDKLLGLGLYPEPEDIKKLDDETRAWIKTLTDGLASSIAYGRSLTDVFDNFLRMIAQSTLAKVFDKGADWLINLLLNGARLSGGKGIGNMARGVAGSLLDAPMATFHFGGLVMHDGGMIKGLRPDEVPIIAQKGERILSRKQNDQFENMLANQQSGSGLQIDKVEIHAVDSKSFTDMLVNNPDAITYIVGNNLINNGELRKLLMNMLG